MLGIEKCLASKLCARCKTCETREFLWSGKPRPTPFRTDETLIFGLSSVRVGVPGPTADEISKSIDAYPGLQEVRRMAESDDEEDPSISLVSLKAKKAAAKKATSASGPPAAAVAKPRPVRPTRTSPASAAQGPPAAVPRSRAKPVGSPAKAATCRDDRSSSAKKADLEEQAAVVAEKRRARQDGAAPTAKRRLVAVDEGEEGEVEEEEEAQSEGDDDEAGQVPRETYWYTEISGCRRPPGTAAAAYLAVAHRDRFKECEYHVR